MALNKECDNRDYLYGRLLAVADRIEYRTFEKEKDTARVTNAKRYMSTFSQRPFEAGVTIGAVGHVLLFVEHNRVFFIGV